MTIEDIALWMMIAGAAIIAIVAVFWPIDEPRVDPTESERRYDQLKERQ